MWLSMIMTMLLGSAWMVEANNIYLWVHDYCCDDCVVLLRLLRVSLPRKCINLAYVLRRLVLDRKMVAQEHSCSALYPVGCITGMPFFDPKTLRKRFVICFEDDMAAIKPFVEIFDGKNYCQSFLFNLFIANLSGC